MNEKELAEKSKEIFHNLQKVNDQLGECMEACPDMKFQNDEGYDNYMECIGNSMHHIATAVKWTRKMMLLNNSV